MATCRLPPTGSAAQAPSTSARTLAGTGQDHVLDEDALLLTQLRQYDLGNLVWMLQVVYTAATVARGQRRGNLPRHASA
jgi:hypothetical protein